MKAPDPDTGASRGESPPRGVLSSIPSTEGRFGGFEIGRCIGKGGMAEVYEAVRAGPHGFYKRVALKRILSDLSKDSVFVRMFIDEAKLAARLEHPNIVQVFDFGEDAGELFLAMELIDGSSVNQILRAAASRGEAVPLESALYITHQCARALAYAHKARDDEGLPLRIVHRDVSPSNMLVTRTGHIKLADFGIAKAVFQKKQSGEGNVRGKLGYMSPEQVLNRPLDELFLTQDTGLEDPILITSDERFLGYLNNPWTLAVFRSFMVKEGLANSVELRGLDAAIAAQERILASANRSFWTPTAALSGEVTQFLAEGGAGKDPITIPGFPGGAAFPRADDTDWGVGVRVSLPLYEGGARFADRKRAIEEVSRLRIERQATRERIALAIETAVLKMQSSGPSIRLSRDARETALKNLDLVTDSYSLGVVSVIDLIDAQTSALVSSQVAANAVYDFLIDLMEMERAANDFDFFRTQEEREVWFERLEKYLKENEAIQRQPYCAPDEALERRSTAP